MREIECRAKAINSDFWVYGYYVYDPESKKSFIYPDEIKQKGFFYTSMCQEIERSSLCECSGFLDDDRISLYEGDILSKNGEIIGVTRYIIPRSKATRPAVQTGICCE